VSSIILLRTAFLLSEMVGGDLSLLFWAVLLVLVTITVIAWRSGLRLIRNRQKVLAVISGVVVLIIALVSSLASWQVFIALVSDL
jgi:hypothetical protein